MHTISNEKLAATARALGQPFWIYDADVIRRQIARLRRFDVIRYAQKANSNLHVLRLMRSEGTHVDAVSLGEIERALAAGYAPTGDDDPLVFTADIIDRATLQRVKTLGIPVNCGSLDMLDQIGRASPGQRVWLRLNPGFGHGHSAKTNTGGEFSKHGIWHEELGKAIALVKAHGLKLIGLHMHIGSGVDYEHLERVCDAMVEHARHLPAPIEAISAGGGLSTPYHDDDREVDCDHYFCLWDAARREIAAYQEHPLRLEIEPGRYLVAQSGRLVAEVYAVKRVAGRHFAMVNAGFNELLRPPMYGSYHRMRFINRETGRVIDSPPQPVAVAGPLCEAGDVFTQSEGGQVVFRDMPLPSVGDLLVIDDVGAYGASMSSNYNSRPLISELLADDDRIDVIRDAQDVRQVFALESNRRVLSSDADGRRDRH